MTESTTTNNETQSSETEDGKTMSVWEHIHELRSRMVRSLAIIFLIFIVAVFFSADIINYLQTPLLNVLPDLEGSKALNFTGPLDVFIASLKVSFLVALVLGCPVWIYQFWRFIEPALYPDERKYVVPFAIASIALFFTGIIFCYFFILPFALEFLIGLGTQVGNAIITIKDYFSLLSVLILGFGLVFETPVILILLGVLELVDSKGLRKHRTIVMVIILVASAMVTPPDPITQVGVAIPVFLMYEASILIIRAIEKSRSPSSTRQKKKVKKNSKKEK